MGLLSKKYNTLLIETDFEQVELRNPWIYFLEVSILLVRS